MRIAAIDFLARNSLVGCEERGVGAHGGRELVAAASESERVMHGIVIRYSGWETNGFFS
jgi:hypothetical protein